MEARRAVSNLSYVCVRKEKVYIILIFSYETTNWIKAKHLILS